MTATTSSASAEQPAVPLPDFREKQIIFALSQSDAVYSATEKQTLKRELLGVIESRAQSSLYAELCSRFKWAPDASLVSTMTESNTKELSDLDSRVKDAEENLGESEVRESLLRRANYFLRIGNFPEAVKAFDVAESKTVAPGVKLDEIFSVIRLNFFRDDFEGVSKAIERANALLEKGADWDRRNRLNVYKAILFMVDRKRRDLAAAGRLLLETLGTYSCEEMMSVAEFVKVAVVISLPTVSRADLKTKVLDSPEVAAVPEGQVGAGLRLARALHDCEYGEVLSLLSATTGEMEREWVLAEHCGWECREIRVRAYAQLLESYRSVQLSSMAREFAVSVPFMDAELSHFIALGRLHCRVDKVGSIVDTNRPDVRNALYQSAITAGDALLNRLQKLARIVVV